MNTHTHGFARTHVLDPVRFWLRYLLLIVKSYGREVHDLWHDDEPDWLYAQYVQELHDEPRRMRRWYVERILMNVLIWRHFHE